MRKSLFFSAMAAGALSAAGLVPDAAAQETSAPRGRGAIAPENAALDRRGLPTLEAGEMRLADRIAADFFENDLRLSQTRRIEAETARYYRSLSPEDREAFRAARRRFYRSMTPDQRLVLRNVKTPAFNNLAEHQKERFRRTALSALSPSPRAGESLGGGSASGSGGGDGQDI